jgi:hypothetical protein
MRAVPGRPAVIALALMLATFVAGCVIIPYRPPAETASDRAEIANPESVRLSVGPRQFLEEMAKAVSKADQRVQLVDGQTFIDTASPTGDLTLARLQDPATKSLIQPLQLDYVVLFAEPVDQKIDGKGGMIFYLGFFGAGQGKGSTTYWAAVLDAGTLKLVEQLSSKSTGTDTAVGLFYGLFVVADTGGSARNDVVRHILATMAAGHPNGPVRVAFLAVEPIPTAEDMAAEAQRRDLATPQWAPDRYATFVAAAPPTQGQALIYLYRPASTDFGLDVITMDFRTGEQEPGTVIARLYSGGYYPFYVPAGDITVQANPWFSAQLPAPIRLSAADGATYYLRGGINRSFWRGVAPALSLVEQENALTELENCRLMPSAREHDRTAVRRAESGDLFAQFHAGAISTTGVTYPDGESFPPDYLAAYKWSLIAKDRFARKKLAGRLTPDEIAAAEQQARQWQEAFDNKRAGQPPGARP